MKRTPEKRKFTDTFVKVLGKKLLKWIENPNNYWLGKFATENGIYRQRLSELASSNEEFHSIYEVAKQIQENRLFEYGATGKIKPVMAIFALKNVAGWRDSIKDEEKKEEEMTLAKFLIPLYDEYH